MPPERIDQLAGQLQEEGFDAFFGWSESTLSYLHGYHEHAGHRFLTLGVNAEGVAALICGALSENQAKRSGIFDIRTYRDGEDPLKLFHDLGTEWELRTAVIAVDEDMPALMLLKMQSVLPAALFKDGGPILAGMRRMKTGDEILLMHQAAKIADEAYDQVKPKIQAGMTERQVEKLLFQAMEARGGNPNFGIVGTGSGGAEPHHASGDSILQRGDVVVLDFGCDVEGYRSDITRVVAIGEASPKAHEVYRIVHQAHMAGRAAAKLGTPVGDVDQAARAVIQAAGYGEQFMHRLGHGIGLQGHEMPYLIPNGTDTLEVGDCFSIEPGIYLADEFGVRIENIFTMTEHGIESLNADPASELEVVG